MQKNFRGEHVSLACANRPSIVEGLVGSRLGVLAADDQVSAAGHLAVAQRLIERGADLNARSTSGFTPLMFAARQGDLAETPILVVTVREDRAHRITCRS